MGPGQIKATSVLFPLCFQLYDIVEIALWVVVQMKP